MSVANVVVDGDYQHYVVVTSSTSNQLSGSILNLLQFVYQSFRDAEE